MTHQCLFCYEDTDRYLLIRKGPFVHGFSICYDVECLVDFRMWLRPDTIMLGSVKWDS